MTAYLYDGAGGTVARGDQTGTDLATKITTYTNNDAGRPISMSAPTEAGNSGNLTGWTYDHGGQKLTQSNPNGTVQSWTYNTAGSNTDGTLANTTVKSGSAVQSSDTYSYDEAYRQITQAYSGKDANNQDVTASDLAYNYDPAGRVSSFQQTPQGGATTTKAVPHYWRPKWTVLLSYPRILYVGSTQPRCK